MAQNPYKRHTTRHRGVKYRERADGSRLYYVYAQGVEHPVEGGEREALARQAELRSMVARGQRITPTAKKLEAVADEWVESKTKLRETTLADYKADLKNVILPRLGHLKPGHISADHLAELTRNLDAKGLSGYRIENILKPLKGVMKFAMRRGYINQNPFDLLTPDERPRIKVRDRHVWSSEEIKRVIAASQALAREEDAKYNYATLIEVDFYTGLRLGELLGLRWCDIDLKNAILHVRHQISKKGKLVEPKTPKAVRRVPLGHDLAALLTRHKLASSFSQENDFVFASIKGTPLNGRNVATRGLAPALKRAGLADADPKITFHDLRHAFASMMIERGLNSVELADLMGHTDSRTTERIYIHLFNRQKMDDKVRSAMQAAMDL